MKNSYEKQKKHDALLFIFHKIIFKISNYKLIIFRLWIFIQLKQNQTMQIKLNKKRKYIDLYPIYNVKSITI